MMDARTIWGLMLAGAALAGCSGGEEAKEEPVMDSVAASPAEPAQARLATMLAGNEELERVNQLAGNAGMIDLLNGVGPYTLFAPTNRAVAALGEERGQALTREDMSAPAAALLRAHIVPGVVTRRDLTAALAAAGDRPVQMRTMAGTMLTFARTDGPMTVSSGDGPPARLVGEEGLAANGAVQPIDALLVPVEGAQAQR